MLTQPLIEQLHALRLHGMAAALEQQHACPDLAHQCFENRLGLMIQQADCQAVFLFDPATKAVGIIHVGWRGSVADIIAETVFVMSRAFAVEPVDISAAVSPSLGPCCAEFINYHTELPAALHAYQVRPNYFDFWAISRDQLCAAGVRPENIQVAGICTCCNRDYFSYRRHKITGRFASVAGIKLV